MARALGLKSEGSSCLPNPVGSPAFPGQPCPPHPPTVRLYVEAGVATPGGEPTWELARAAGSARSLKPLSINCGSWSWSWRPLTASLPRHRRSLIFQSEEGGKKTLLLRPAPSNWDLGKAFPFDRIAHPWRSWGKKKKKLWDPILSLGEVAASSSSLLMPGRTSHKPWAGEDPPRNSSTPEDRGTTPRLLGSRRTRRPHRDTPRGPTSPRQTPARFLQLALTHNISLWTPVNY